MLHPAAAAYNYFYRQQFLGEQSSKIAKDCRLWEEARKPSYNFSGTVYEKHFSKTAFQRTSRPC
jgi:hypothetical protein